MAWIVWFEKSPLMAGLNNFFFFFMIFVYHYLRSNILGSDMLFNYFVHVLTEDESHR
jgi:hypothetical protein